MIRKSALSPSRASSTKVLRGRCMSSAPCAESVPTQVLLLRPGSGRVRLEQGQVEVEDFYRHMSDMGLRYGDEFRPIRELSAGNGESTGRVSLSDAIMRRAREYPLHPVLFDGALQIFSAGAATVEDHKPRLRLPVRFAKILFLRSPGDSSLVRAAVQQCNDECVEGRLEMYDGAGKPCVLIDGFRAISVSGARRSDVLGETRNVLYHLSVGANACPVAPRIFSTAGTIGSLATRSPRCTRPGDRHARPSRASECHGSR